MNPAETADAGLDPRSFTQTAMDLVRTVWAHPGNRHRRVRAVTKTVTWQVWERTVRRPWTTSLPGGMRLRVHPHSPSAAGSLYCGMLEWEHMSFVKDYVAGGDVVVDVGANVGVYTLLMAGAGAERIWAFEPGTQARARLAENVAANRLGSRVRIVDAAVADHEGTARLTVGFDAMDKLLVDGDATRSVEVALTTLDAAIPADDRAPVRLVKIDVEGFEAEVLRGAGALLEAAHPALIVEANDIDPVRRELEPLGYANYAYDPDTRRLHAAEWGRDAPNLLAIADLDAARARLC